MSKRCVWVLVYHNKKSIYHSGNVYMAKRFSRAMGNRLAFAAATFDRLAIFKTKAEAEDFLFDRWAKYPKELPNKFEARRRMWGGYDPRRKR